jgi:antitoxin (DNA-binding transcriptional repressor) of toxin-antitoxin stability system
MNVAEAQRDFPQLVNRVHTEGISVDLEQDDKVIARLSPVAVEPVLTVGALFRFLENLPSLGDDAERFSREIKSIRAEAVPGKNPWD